MPGFAADDEQEVSSPYSYVNSHQDPAAALSSNFNAGYGGGYQGESSGAGNENPVGYSGGNADTSRAGNPGASSKTDSGASRSMVDSMSGGGNSDTMGGGSSGDAFGSPTLPTYPDHIIDEQTGVAIRLPQTKSEVRRVQSQFRDLGYPISVDGRMGPQTKGVITQFQKDWNAAHQNDQITIDGYLGIAPPGVAQTGPRLDAAHANMLANRSGYVGAGQQPAGAYVPPAAPVVVSPLAAAAPPSPTPRPASPLEALRASPGGGAAGTQGAVGAPNHEEAIKAIIAPFSVGAGKMPGAGLQYAQTEAGPDYGKRSADARRGPVRINQGPELPGRAPAAAAVPVVGGFGAPENVPAGYRPPPPAAPQQAQGVGAPDMGTATPVEPVAFLPREPNMTATRNERTGTPGRVPTNPIQPGATTVSSLEAARPTRDFTSEPSLPGAPDAYGALVARKAAGETMSPLEAIRRGLGVGSPPGDASVEQPQTPLASGPALWPGLRTDVARGAPRPAPPAGGGATSADKVLNILGLGQPAAPAGGGIPADTSTPEITAADRAAALAARPAGTNYGGEGQPFQTGPEGQGAGIPWATPQAGDEGAHAAALKQVTDMMANQPPEKQQAVADHMVIFAHAASLVAAAPPEQRAAAFDEQLTRLKSMGAIDDATEKKMRGTTPTDAQLNQMIELGKAVHDMGIGQPQSSLENARGVQVAGPYEPVRPPARINPAVDNAVAFNRAQSKWGGVDPGAPEVRPENQPSIDVRRTQPMGDSGEPGGIPLDDGSMLRANGLDTLPLNFYLGEPKTRTQEEQFQHLQKEMPAPGRQYRPRADASGPSGQRVAQADETISERPLQRPREETRAMGYRPNIWGESEDPMLDRAIDLPAEPAYHAYPEEFYGDRRGGGATVRNDTRRRRQSA